MKTWVFAIIIVLEIMAIVGMFLVDHKLQHWYYEPQFSKAGYETRSTWLNGCQVKTPKGWVDCPVFNPKSATFSND